MSAKRKGLRPTDARSLVGASQGARKRWVRAHVERNMATHDGWRGEGYKIMLREVRIGDRLRPCPGCLKCQHLDACYWCENMETEGDICDRCGRVHVVDTLCDGSGVIAKGPAHV